MNCPTVVYHGIIELSKPKQKLVLIDAHALIHRAFHALPPWPQRRHGRQCGLRFFDDSF